MRAQEVELHFTDQERNEGNSSETAVAVHSPAPQTRQLKWWIRIAIYILSILVGQSVATLLGRLYYVKGGKSVWLSSLISYIGFPILLPLYCLLPRTNTDDGDSHPKRPSVVKLASVYIYLGLLAAGDTMLYSIGLLLLPVSTYSLISASQLAFNALFAFFINKQKLTPCILNSVVLLTVSSTLLIFHSDSSSSTVSKAKYTTGFICTLAASAVFSFLLSTTELIFDRVLKQQTFKAILDMLIYQSLIASCATAIGLFAGGDWRTLQKEMEDFELGKVSYLMTLIWIAVTWQVFAVGIVGLLVEVSSLFSNVIGTLGLPVIPALAVIFFHDKMDGIKVVAMFLAIWGFGSYTYQHYLDDQQAKIVNQDTIQPPDNLH